MFLKIVIIFAFFLLTSIVKAEDKKDSIKVEYAFWGNSFFIDGKEYSRNYIQDLLNDYPHTNDLMKISKIKKNFSYFTLPTGIILSGYSMYHYYKLLKRGSSFNPTTKKLPIYIPIAALCFDLSSIILISDANKSFYSAIRKYNKNISKETNSSLYEIDFQYGLSYLSLTFKF